MVILPVEAISGLQIPTTAWQFFLLVRLMHALRGSLLLEVMPEVMLRLLSHEKLQELSLYIAESLSVTPRWFRLSGQKLSLVR
jgi:hypothetical protein